MDYEVIITRTAMQEYRESLNYLAQKLASPQAMRNLNAELQSAKRALAATPNWFPIHYGASAATGKTIRKVRVRNHLLHYLVDEGSHKVQAISFLHSRQDAVQHVVRDLELLS